MGVPVWIALTHDLSKFSLAEWTPYVNQFYNRDGTLKKGIRDDTGYYDPSAQPIPFQLAWIHHQRNKHHWQSWISIGDSGRLSATPIPEVYIREMIADWIGAGLVEGKSNPIGWYAKNGDKMILHPETRKMLESLLEALGRGEYDIAF